MVLKSKFPAFRVVGVSSNTEGCALIAKTHKDYGNINFSMHNTHAWKLLGKMESDTATLARIYEIFAWNVDKNKQRKLNFDAYCDEKKRVANIDDEREVHDRNQREILGEARSVMRPDASCDATAGSGALVAGQEYVVVGIIGPHEGDYIFNVFATFGDLGNAKRYSQETLADKYESFDVICVDSNEWIYPHLATHNDIPRGYRHQTLQEVMKYKRIEKERIRSHKTDCDRQGVPMRVTTVTGKSDAPLAKPAVEINYSTDA